MYHTDYSRGKGDYAAHARLPEPYTIPVKEKQYGENSETNRGMPTFSEIVAAPPLSYASASRSPSASG
jgi:hypothetical protein